MVINVMILQNINYKTEIIILKITYNIYILLFIFKV